MSSRLSVAAIALSLVLLPASAAMADEGMWTFDNFPTAQVNQKYGTAIDQAWLNRVRGVAMRLSSGCSASAVSIKGLALTNHHCVVSCVQDLSDAEDDYLAKGWLVHSRTEERQCPGVDAQILTRITDVTDRVLAADARTEGAAFVAARATVNRTVTVSTAAVTEALRSVYELPHLLEDLGVANPRRR